jgi:hypothetical protein
MTTPKPHTRRCLDSPTGRPVYYLGPAGDGYARVESLNRRVRFETPESRLHKPLT